MTVINTVSKKQKQKKTFILTRNQVGLEHVRPAWSFGNNLELFISQSPNLAGDTPFPLPQM